MCLPVDQPRFNIFKLLTPGVSGPAEALEWEPAIHERDSTHKPWRNEQLVDVHR